MKKFLQVNGVRYDARDVLAVVEAARYQAMVDAYGHIDMSSKPENVISPDELTEPIKTVYFAVYNAS